MLSSRDRRDREDSRDRDRDRKRERGRDRSRERRHSGSGDLRDRLDRFKDSDYRDHRDQHCDITESGKKQLLSMFLEDKNPEKDFKGKENGDLEHLLENNRKERKDLEKKLSSEWSERKKKKKKRSKSRSKDRQPLGNKDSENRKRKLSPSSSYVSKDNETSDGTKSKKDKARSPSRGEAKKKKKEKKNRNKSQSKEKPRSPSKTSSGSRKSRIDSGISVSTNFSKESLSISPRDERISSPIKEKESSDVDKSSPKKEIQDSPNKSPQKPDSTCNPDAPKHTNSPSPSPPRRVLELPAEENEEKKSDGHEKETESKEVDPKNPYSVYETKHGVRVDSKDQKRRSRSRGKRSRSRERRTRTRSRDRHRRSRERDLKDEIDDMRRDRRRREYYHGGYPRRPREYHRHSSRYSPPHRHPARRSVSRDRDPASWEDKVNSFLASTNTAPASTSLVEITKSEILPTDFDPSKPPPGMAVIPPDYAIKEFAGEEETEGAAVPVTGQPIRMLTDVQTGQLIPQPRAAVAPLTPTAEMPYMPPAPPVPVVPSVPPPDYQQTMDITITAQPQAQPAVTLEQEIAALNALNQEREKNKKDDKPLTVKEKKKLEKGRKELWQFVSKKLLSDPVFCNKVKKKKSKAIDELKEKAEKCAVRIGLKLEKSGFSETRLWLMLKDNEKGIVGFHDELSAAVINGTIETDVDARKPKDRLDAELMKDGTVFKYIGQYIQANPTLGKHESMPSSGDLQSILDTVNTNSNSSPPESPNPDTAAPPEAESEWDLAIKSFAPFKTYLSGQNVPPEVTDAYGLCLVLSGFTYSSLQLCVTNFQPPEPENPDEPPETVYGHLLNCLREISFEKYPRIITENMDGHTVSIVRFVLDHYSKPRSPTPPAAGAESRKSSPVPPCEDAVPTGGNTTCQLPRKKYVLVSVSVDTIPVENGLAVWQVENTQQYFRTLYFNVTIFLDLSPYARSA